MSIFALSLFILTFNFSFADTQQQTKEAIQKLEALTKRKCNCQTDLKTGHQTLSQMEKICDSASGPGPSPVTPADALRLYKKILSAYQQFIQGSSELSQRQKEALAQRLQKIPEPHFILCKSTDIHYDNLKNKIEGCVSKEFSAKQIGFILSHELGHAVGPCAYHAGWSPFNLLKLGQSLQYSEPMNYKKSLEEFPLKAMISCQPSEVIQHQLINSVDNRSWNVMCARTKQEELFADLIGSRIYAQILKEEGHLNEKSFFELAKVFCPTKGIIREIRFEKGQSQTKERVDWLEPAGYPSFDLRLDALFEGLKNGNALKEIDQIAIKTGPLQNCYRP